MVTNDSIVNPVHIIRTYFRLCGFKFGLANGDKSLVNYGSGERAGPGALEDAQHAATLQSELGVVQEARGQPGSC